MMKNWLTEISEELNVFELSKLDSLRETVREGYPEASDERIDGLIEMVIMRDLVRMWLRDRKK
jgi:hypothetical protein